MTLEFQIWVIDENEDPVVASSCALFKEYRIISAVTIYEFMALGSKEK